MKSIRVLVVILLGMIGIAGSVWGQSLPTIKALSESRTVVETGEQLELHVNADGEGPLQYQWVRNGYKIPGATGRSYVVNSARAAVDSGWYRVTVSNAAGSVVSRVIFVNVVIKNPRFTFLPENSPVNRVPPDLGSICAIALGGFHILALRRDGTVRDWGQFSFQYAPVPEGLNNVVAVATSYGASFALRADGTVVSWGYSYLTADALREWSDVVQLSAGLGHLLLLTSDYRVQAWGSNTGTQTMVPENMGKVVGVAASSSTSFAWTEDGQIYAWGDNASLQVTDGKFALAGSKVISVVGGEDFCLGLISRFGQDSLVGWGRSYSHVDQHPFIRGEKVIGVKAGDTSAVALLDNDNAVMWGFTESAGSYSQKPIPNAQLIDAIGESIVVVSAGPDDGKDDIAAIRIHPQSHDVRPGQLVVLNCLAESPLATYQWYRNGAAIPGATGSNYSFLASGGSGEGQFACQVSVASGSAMSRSADIRLRAVAPKPRFRNLSVRSRLKEGEEAVILGFALRRENDLGAEDLLIRAAGPALQQFGLTQVAADPWIELMDGGRVRQSNDNWNDDAATVNATQNAGTFPFSPGGKDAALVANNLGAGPYTVRVHNREAGAPSVALAEVYRAGNASAEDQVGLDLINLSARGGVGAGEDTLTLGFVIEGMVSKTVLITGIGKALAAFGITRPVEDPVLRLYQGNKFLWQNDNGQEGDAGQRFSQMAGRAGSLAVSDATSAGMVLTLAPGAYSVQLSDKGGGAGVALVEVFAVE